MTFNITRRKAFFLFAAPVFARSRPAVSVTMDDVGWQTIPEDRRAEAEERLLSSLGQTQAFLFAVGKNVDNEHGAAILRAWSAAGHRIGNHTYDHVALRAGVNPEAFKQSVIHAEEVLRVYPGFRKYFRFPVLKEGKTRDVRDRVRAFLALRGYRNGAVTIDASDWYYSQRLVERLTADRGFDVARFREPYLDHIWDRAQYYDGLAQDVLGRGVDHTLLVHYNLLNSLFLKDLLAMFEAKGWGVINAEQAFADPVFDRLPNIAPAGESLIWALAKETGKFDARLRYPGEDSTYEKSKLDRLDL